MNKSKKKLIYIHPKNLRYYEDHEIFSILKGFESYIITDDIRTSESFSHFRNHIIGNYKEILSPKIYYVKNFKEILRNIRPSIVVTKEIFSLQSLLVHKMAKQLKFKHLIISYENTDFNNSLWGLFLLTRFISYVNRKSIFIAVSSAVRENLLKIGVKKENIIQTATGLFPSPYCFHQLSSKRFKMLYVGNITYNKGIITLISAFKAIINEGYGNMYLTIAGKGPLAEYVKSQSKKFENLTYLGYVSDDKKRLLMNDSDLFIYPSEDMYILGIITRWSEQTATSVMESMRLGLPIIASNSGSLPEILGRTDVIFEQGNAEQLKNKILMVYKDEELRKGLRLYFRDRFLSEFDIFKNAEKISKYLRDLKS